MSKLKEKLILPKIKTKLDLLEDESLYFEDINKLDKYIENIDKMEDK